MRLLGEEGRKLFFVYSTLELRGYIQSNRVCLTFNSPMNPKGMIFSQINPIWPNHHTKKLGVKLVGIFLGDITFNVEMTSGDPCVRQHALEVCTGMTD